MLGLKKAINSFIVTKKRFKKKGSKRVYRGGSGTGNGNGSEVGTGNGSEGGTGLMGKIISSFNTADPNMKKPEATNVTTTQNKNKELIDKLEAAVYNVKNALGTHTNVAHTQNSAFNGTMNGGRWSRRRRSARRRR